VILAADDIARLVEHMRRSGVAEIEIADGDDALRLALPETGDAVPAPVAPTVVTATACGVFLPGHPAREPKAPIGSPVEAGEVVAVLALGPLLQPVVAPHAGMLARLLCPAGQRVDFGTPLFELVPHPQSPEFVKRKDV